MRFQSLHTLGQITGDGLLLASGHAISLMDFIQAMLGIGRERFCTARSGILRLNEMHLKCGR
jgi:hypothetical protein